MVARYWLEELAGIPCQVEVASEFRYRKVVVQPDSLFVTISQSGETADTLAALRNAKELGFRQPGDLQRQHQLLVRESDLTFADPGRSRNRRGLHQSLSPPNWSAFAADLRPGLACVAPGPGVEATLVEELRRPADRSAKRWRWTAPLKSRRSCSPTRTTPRSSAVARNTRWRWKAPEAQEISYIHALSPAGEVETRPIGPGG